MFGFINPTVLFALFAGLLPLLIHFLNRKKVKEISFSTIHFLREMVRKEMRRLKLRQIFLLIIRILIILLVVLVFARPTFQNRNTFIQGHSSSEAVIILDNSLSMNTLKLSGIILENIKQRLSQLEPIFNNRDKISIILGVKPLKIISFRESPSSGFWNKIVDEIQPSRFTGVLGDAILEAKRILMETESLNRELYIISDFQKTQNLVKVINRIQDDELKNTRIFLLPIKPSNEENVSVDSVIILNKMLEKNQKLKVACILHNHHNTSNVNSIISLILQNNRVAQNNIDLSPNESKQIVLETTLQYDGIVSGHIECESDALIEDNRYYFNFFVPQNIEVLHITPSNDYPSFMPLILEPANEKNLIKYKNQVITDKRSSFTNSQVIIFEGMDQIPIDFENQLYQLSQQGKGIIVIPGANLNLPQFNKILKKLGFGVILDKKGDRNNNSFINIGEVDWNHPLFDGLFNEPAQLNPIQVFEYYSLKNNISEAIISLQNGDPFLLGRQQNKSQIFMFSVPLQMEWTNIVTKGFIVPLFYRMMYYSASHSAHERKNIKVGNAYIENFKNLSPPYNFELLRPSGMVEKIVPEFKEQNILFRFEENNELGNYQIWQRDELLTTYAVNHDPIESVPIYYNNKELESIFESGLIIDEDQDAFLEIEKKRYGKELWPFVLSVVFLLLLLEMIIAYTGSLKAGSKIQNESISL